MKFRRTFLLVLLATLTLAFTAPAFAQTVNDGRLANISGGGSNVRLDVLITNAGSTLTISAPDGRSFRKEFKAGVAPEFSIFDQGNDRLPDGVYTYELRLNPGAISAEKAKSLRASDDDSESKRTSRKSQASNLVQSGSFAILNGSVVVAGAVEGSKSVAAATTPGTDTPTFKLPARLRNHPVLRSPFDQVIADDLIVQGSVCAGLDCVNNENFGFDTIRVKENNNRIQFDDTSASAGFATNNWQIRANSSASGGASFLGFVDQGATANSETGTIVFQVDAGASANAIHVGSNSKVGLRTATPVLDLHMNTTDTPAVRFEQNNSAGFTAQTWDIGANEANFFVRDVTSGSRLPLRVRPGAPTSSLDIAASGNVGIGTASPASKLTVESTTVDAGGDTYLRVRNTTSFAGVLIDPNQAGDTDWLLVGGFPNAGDFTIREFNVGNWLTVKKTTGRVGIGTAAPDQLFSVNGDASKVGGGSWQSFSDARLKNIHGQFSTGLNAVMRLQPLRFEYKRDNPLGLTSNGEHVGFSAQELQKVIPEAVTVSDSGYLMVNNDPILWTMLNAIKEQQKQIEELKSEVQKLREQANKQPK